jgi:hypothetical protein
LHPQLWPDLGRAKLKAMLPSVRVDIGQRGAFLLEAKLGDREDDKASSTKNRLAGGSAVNHISSRDSRHYERSAPK